MTAAGPTRRIRCFEGAEEIGRIAAAEFIRAGLAAIADRGRFHVALAGGLTPRRAYQLLGADPFRRQLDWTRVEFFWGDERAVPPGHHDSNYRMAREAMLDRLAVKESQIHRMRGEVEPLEVAAHEYQELMARIFRVPPNGPPPVFDLILLGLGADGHTASIFPGTPAVRELFRWVMPNVRPGVARGERLTLTVPVLNRARVVTFLVTGKDKAEAVATILEGGGEAEPPPARLVAPPAGQVEWLLDREAASALRQSGGN